MLTRTRLRANTIPAAQEMNGYQIPSDTIVDIADGLGIGKSRVIGVEYRKGRADAIAP